MTLGMNSPASGKTSRMNPTFAATAKSALALCTSSCDISREVLEYRAQNNDFLSTASGETAVTPLGMIVKPIHVYSS